MTWPVTLGTTSKPPETFLRHAQSSVWSAHHRKTSLTSTCTTLSRLPSTLQSTLTLARFIYGGSTNQTWDWTNPDDDGFLSLYTLSLPGFRWFKSNQTTPVRRSNHYCQIIGSTASNGNSQMLSIGGRQPSSLASLGVPPDPWTNGLAVFDMNTFSWAEFYDAAEIGR